MRRYITSIYIIVFIFTVLAAGMLPFPVSADISTGLVGHWAFDGDTLDSSGQGNHGTAQGGPTFGTGQVGQALEFDGVDDYIDLGDLSIVEGQPQLSVSVWVKSNLSEIVSGGADFIVSKTGSGADTFELGWSQPEDVFFCVVGTSGTSCPAYALFTDGIPAGSGTQWHHVVGTYDGATMRVYVNAIEGDITQSLTELSQNSSHPIRIGSSDPGGLWNGLIDDVRIYNRALSAADVAELYAYGGESPPPAQQCSDGLDNDSDGLTDYPADPGCTSSSDTDETNAPADTTPPTRSNAAPSGTLPAGITQTTLSLTTNENATCRYSTVAGTSYGSMTSVFSSTGGTSHSTIVSGLQNGQSYTYYARCQDAAGNANTTDFTIQFSVASGSGSTLANVDSFTTAGCGTVEPLGSSWVTNNASALPVVGERCSRYYAELNDNTNDITLHFNNSQGRLDAQLMAFPFEYIARNIGIGTSANTQSAPNPSGTPFMFAGVQVHVTDLNSRNSSHVVIGHRGSTRFSIEGKNTVNGSSSVNDEGVNVLPLGRGDIRIVGNSNRTLTVYWQQPNPNPGVQADSWQLYRGTGLLPGTTPTYGQSVYVGLITYAQGSTGVPFVGTADSVEWNTAPPPDTTSPTTPTNLFANAQSSSQISLTWTPSSDNVGVTGYRIYRGGVLLITTTNAFYTDSGLLANTTYAYTVSAIDAAGNESGQSNSTQATTQAGGGSPPSGSWVPPIGIPDPGDWFLSENGTIQNVTTGGSSRTFSGTGTANAPLIFKGIGNPRFTGQVTISGSYVIVDGINVDGGTVRINGDHIVLRNSEVHNYQPGGNSTAVFTSGSTDVVIYNNTVHDNGNLSSTAEQDVHGIGAATSWRVWIVDNETYRNSGDSVQVGHGQNNTVGDIYIGRNVMHDDRENAVDIKEASNVIISENEMYNYVPTGSSEGAAVVIHYCHYNAQVILNTIHNSEIGISSTSLLSGCSLPITNGIIGNVIYDIGGNAIQGWGSGKVTHIANNTLHNVGGAGIDLTNPMNGSTIVNNIFSNVTGSDIVVSPSSSISPSNNLADSTNSQFVNSALNNFHLQASSPAVGSGMSLPTAYTNYQNVYGISIAVDIDGTSRPQDSTWDIGAYEFVSGSPQPLVGDLNADGTVNALDWSIMNAVWFTSDPTADLNNDGLVNSIDFGLLNANWNQTA